MKHRSFAFLTRLVPVLLVLATAGCRSLDDDSEYAIGNKASFFWVEDDYGVRSIVKYVNHGLETSWNSKVGVYDLELGDVLMDENYMWLSNRAQKSILKIGPSSGDVVERFAQLPLTPEFFAVGRKQIIVADSGAHKLAMIRRRDGEVQMLEFDQKPGQCLYNSGKFYVEQNDSLLAVIDEQAMTQRVVLSLNMTVTELMLNRYHTIVAMGFDNVSGNHRQALIDANGDLLIRGNSFNVLFKKFRPTPYFATKFGNEYLSDLMLKDTTILNDTNVTIIPSTYELEADFLEGNVYYIRDASLVVRHITTKARIDSLPFYGFSILKGMYQYADE